MIFLHISLNDKNHKNVHKFFSDVKKPADIRLCENTLMTVPTNAPTCSGRLLLCSQQTKKGLSAHQRHHLA
ncbi:hypothetical protein, partial [Pseudomonas fluorescens]|uniref:hypothetical protein n=1 Tax=Pseudomonas fluorescens TaxID=294 RepID=UPI001CD61985